MSDTRQEAHAYLDRLPSDQLSAVHDLLESMLSPLDRALALAPMDDEPLTPEDVAALERDMASPETAGATMEEVLADFGLTIGDLRRNALTEKK